MIRLVKKDIIGKEHVIIDVFFLRLERWLKGKDAQ